MGNAMQDLLAKQSAAGARRLGSAVSDAARVTVAGRGAPTRGVYPGVISDVLGPDANGINRYSVQLTTGWEKGDGPVVLYAMVADDDATALTVGMKVCVAVNSPSPALIISGGGGLTIEDVGMPVWYYGWLNNSGV